MTLKCAIGSLLINDQNVGTAPSKAIESVLRNKTVEKHSINFLSKEGWAHSSPIQFMGL
jgi:hypothetical protein